ncbi:hypothetical protein [Spirosoma pollinicola]|uniref:Uncharacterized protein n=1 Tax=Spirosoma pollinicola TaxID=2057025 RepID=A0A2K8Z4A1_9BACT|nr:hypothetical protein [Spirosoma pollinicola]AUD04693.1 hypothetical protein CWM47_24305 [Spirosoma pollinicola]
MLTPTQLTAIDQHLRKENWLLNEELIDELKDHYTEGIEERLSQGMAFDVALREIQAGFGGRKGLLKMEEDFQVHNHRKIGQLEWKFVRSFMHGAKWPFTVCLFVSLYAVNVYTGEEDIVRTGLSFGFVLVTVSVLVNVAQSLYFFYWNRNEVNQAVGQPSSPVYITTYLLGMSLLLLNKYGFAKYGSSFPNSAVLLLETLLETLCLVYYAAIALATRQILLKERNNRLPKAT